MQLRRLLALVAQLRCCAAPATRRWSRSVADPGPEIVNTIRPWESFSLDRAGTRKCPTGGPGVGVGLGVGDGVGLGVGDGVGLGVGDGVGVGVGDGLGVGVGDGLGVGVGDGLGVGV